MLTGAMVEWVLGTIGVALLLAFVTSGLAGDDRVGVLRRLQRRQDGQSIIASVNGALRDLGFKAQTSLEVTFGIGCSSRSPSCSASTGSGWPARERSGGKPSTLELARSFAHTLVPIALAYVAAHYVSLLLFGGQAIAPLASDPLGEGWNVLGTAAWTIDYGFLGAQTF